MKIPLFCQQMAKEWYFLLAKHCLEEFKLDCQLRRLTDRTIKGYYNNTLNFLIYCHHANCNQRPVLWLALWFSQDGYDCIAPRRGDRFP